MGEEDAGHGECGASLSVEKSVANTIDFSILVPSVGLFVPDTGFNEPLLRKNATAKEAKLLEGFFSDWSNEKHEDYLRTNFPQNFSNLLIDHNDHETFGHNGSGMLVVTGDNQGYQKSGHAFAVTLPKMREIAYRLGGSDEERHRILLGFADDTLHVGGGIVTEGFPVFAQVA
jgi:hypothetical protein